jgi:cyclophilin family peptidyl-prolyl cis-trans isomerase
MHIPLLAAAAAAMLASALPAQSPSEIVAAAPASEWRAIAPDRLLVMDLPPDPRGAARRVVIELMPPPFSVDHIANIRTLARAHWWDGTSINRVQDNYVVQWGDATERKPLPPGLRTVAESGYLLPASAIARTRAADARGEAGRWHSRDAYAAWVGLHDGWPVASDGRSAWPLHCYGMVGVGRNVAPDTGSGAELYVVIGQAPRHLDRNIALVGRVVAGIEHLSSLPRGTAQLGFYQDAADNVPIAAIRLASTLPAAEQPRYETLATDGPSFARYVAARANRRDDFFITPAGGIDICNAPVPVRPRAD